MKAIIVVQPAWCSCTPACDNSSQIPYPLSVSPWLKPQSWVEVELPAAVPFQATLSMNPPDFIDATLKSMMWGNIVGEDASVTVLVNVTPASVDVRRVEANARDWRMDGV
jgi:hypothetical protein